MIKILDNVDLKELEKYGFHYVISEIDNYWFKKVYCNDENDGRIYYTIYPTTNDEFTGRAIYIDSCGDSRLDNTLYALIKDGIAGIDSDAEN